MGVFSESSRGAGTEVLSSAQVEGLMEAVQPSVSWAASRREIISLPGPSPVSTTRRRVMEKPLPFREVMNAPT